MVKLREFIEKINMETEFTGDIRYGEPMAPHTTFKIGGPADCWIRPGKEFPRYAAALLSAARPAGIPVFILGGGANLVVSDRGIRGIVLDTGGWTGFSVEEPGTAAIPSGTTVDEAAQAAAEQGLGGLEFLAGMPGTIGGAVWMNARCYEKETADVLLETEFLDESLKLRREPCRREDFSYKKSPFQDHFTLILSARFKLQPRPWTEILQEMEAHRRDREAKGHYRHPSAGSVFKNDRAFGKPTGKIIDELGLRGLSRGGAAIAPYHGNIIINTGSAHAADIRALVTLVQEKVRAATGFNLTPEIIFAGEW